MSNYKVQFKATDTSSFVRVENLPKDQQEVLRKHGLLFRYVTMDKERNISEIVEELQHGKKPFTYQNLIDGFKNETGPVFEYLSKLRPHALWIELNRSDKNVNHEKEPYAQLLLGLERLSYHHVTNKGLAPLQTKLDYKDVKTLYFYQSLPKLIADIKSAVVKRGEMNLVPVAENKRYMLHFKGSDSIPKYHVGEYLEFEGGIYYVADINNNEYYLKSEDEDGITDFYEISRIDRSSALYIRRGDLDRKSDLTEIQKISNFFESRWPTCELSWDTDGESRFMYAVIHNPNGFPDRIVKLRFVIDLFDKLVRRSIYYHQTRNSGVIVREGEFTKEELKFFDSLGYETSYTLEDAVRQNIGEWINDEE